ncbi:MAG TPA: PAS domain-containing protein [Chryseosolibacter sp.]|nr:PAS domain-containing protein [Chryseosolibacter sp.]
MQERSLPQKDTRQESLAGSDEKFHLLAENVPGVVYLCNNDEKYTVIFINDQITTLTGHSKHDFYAGKVSFADLFHPDDKQNIFDIINRSVAERKPYKLRYRIHHASGSWRWVDETGTGVYDGDKLVMLEGFILDVTLQKEAEEKLWKAVEENLRFFNSPVNLNAVADLDANLIRISPSWTRILGWSEEELKSQSLFSFVHPEDIEDTRNAFEAIKKTGNVVTFENRLKCIGDMHHWFLWALVADLPAGLIYGSAIDISARKKSESNILESKSNLEGLTRQLQDQNRKLDEFAHIISHNLRAPVNNIQALINLLDDKSEISDYKLIYEKLKNVAKNLSETMNELMDTLKAKTQQNVDLSDVRFKEVLDKVVQSLEGELIVAEASVTFDFNEAPHVNYSKPYLESIFQNLLTNAIKYRSPSRKPAIHFKSQRVDGHLELRVSDNGQGIDMAKFGDKLFGLHKTFHAHHEARGVGLFLVKTQIEALGGSIRVESEVDKGSTFIITFH